MMHELLWECFVLNDYASGFDFFSKYVCTLLEIVFHFQYHVCFSHLDS